MDFDEMVNYHTWAWAWPGGKRKTTTRKVEILTRQRTARAAKVSRVRFRNVPMLHTLGELFRMRQLGKFKVPLPGDLIEAIFTQSKQYFLLINKMGVKRTIAGATTPTLLP